MTAVLRLTAVGAAVAACAFIAAGSARSEGSFVSTDPGLNAIWQASVQTAEDMLAPGPIATDALGRPCQIELPAVILDGVVRDRCPYIGDESVIGATFDVSEPRFDVQRDMLAWFAAHQHGDGAIPSSPLSDGGIVLYDYNAYWVQTLYRYALYSGDLAFVRQVWPNLVRVLGWYAARPNVGGLVGNDIGPRDYGFIRRQGSVVAYYNAQYVLALRDAVELAGWVGASNDQQIWAERALSIAGAFTPAFWDERAGAFTDTTTDRETHPQDGNSFAILAGIATPLQAVSALNYLTDHNQRAYGNTIADTQAWDDAAWGYQANGRVYPFMSYYELVARFEEKLDASAFYLLRREWGYMLARGPGTMWETIGQFGGGPTDQNPSWDAGWSSGAAPALTEYVLGVKPTSPGFATFTVTPHTGGVDGGVESAAGSVPTPHGDIQVVWRQGPGGKLSLRVTAPPGTVWANAPSVRKAPGKKPARSSR